MPNLYSSRHIIFVLRKRGFSFIAQKGSHIKFHKNPSYIVIVPANKKEIPLGTFRSILRQAGLKAEDFKK